MEKRVWLWVRKSWGQTGSPVQWQMLCGLIFFGIMALMIAQAASVNAQHWEIEGEMIEACTCQAPCACNFGQGPSPQHYCWSLASFRVDRGHYGAVNLTGLRLVRAHGANSVVWYIDNLATPQQTEALRAIAARVSGTSHLPNYLHFESARIVQKIGNRSFQIEIGNKGGFEASEIMGEDGKNPIVVENMTAWNVQHDIKGKTKRLYYKDEFGNQFDLTNTNANEGKFDWTDKTPDYF